MYSDLLLERTSDGGIRFGIRKNIDNIYEYPGFAKDQKIAISFLPNMLFPGHAVVTTEQRQFFPYNWPFSSVVCIDTLFVLKPVSEREPGPMLRGCDLFERF